MAEDLTRWARISLYLRLPFTAVPMYFRKYDAAQATRLSVSVLASSVREILGEHAQRGLATIVKAAFYLSGPLLIGFAARVAAAAPAIDYRVLWQTFSLGVIGLTLSIYALGRLTLSDNARANFRPLATLPVRAGLLGVLWLPVPLSLGFEASLLFAGTTLAAYFLTAPHLAQWLDLGVLHWGSPRRAGLAQATSMSMIDAPSLERMCAHEAGHALMFGLGDEIPEDLYLYVDREFVGDGAAGAVVAAAEFTPAQANLEQLKFRLIVLAAGAAGEQVRLGSRSLAAAADFAALEGIALLYLLSAGFPVIAEPETTEEYQVNAAAIAKLRSEMIDLAARIIEANREVHGELIEMLLERSDLAYDDVLPVLSKVKRVSEAPRPTWSEAIVTHLLKRKG